MSPLVAPEPVQVTVWEGGAQLVVDVPAGPLAGGLPESVVRHLVESGRAAPEPPAPTTKRKPPVASEEN